MGFPALPGRVMAKMTDFHTRPFKSDVLHLVKIKIIFKLCSFSGKSTDSRKKSFRAWISMKKKFRNSLGKKKKLTWDFFSTKPDMSMIFSCLFYSKLQSEANRSAKITRIP